MSRPENLQTKIFLDSGDPNETKEVIELLGFIDGQTTNPSLVAKKLKKGDEQIKLSKEKLLDTYKSIVQEISSLAPNMDSVSIEVYADHQTMANQMIEQGKEMNTWINNAHIKLPTTSEGLKAAEALTREGIRVNMTLVFSQEQGAAVYSATKEAQKGQVFLSPFIGRLDDKMQNGMDLIKNTLKMYKDGDQHVEVLTASVRNLEHFLAAISIGSDILTAPMKILKEWKKEGMPIPDSSYAYERPELSPIKYQDLNLLADWSTFNIKHELTDVGIDKFTKDWNDLIG